jgi:anaerobic nitric oxide reductase flavorubredoxin
MVVEIAKDLFWVGVVDWDLRKFHGHELSVHRGSTYNSYLIRDEKVVLVDTVWNPFQKELIKNISEVVDPARIDIVVANHSETDHAGGLPAIMELAPKATVIVSTRGMDSIPGHFHQAWNFKAVKTGDRINIGKHELAFIEATMLHWPDSMFTYLTGENILMSNDAFGQHYASSKRFNDEVDETEVYQEAIKYYANILTPFSPLVTRKIKEVLDLKLPVNIIAPSHGIIWRKDPLQIVQKYQEWAAQKPEESAVILYDTMWQATRQMAEAIGRGLGAENVPYKIFNMAIADRNDVITEVFKAKAIIVGSPTFNQGVLPTLRPILEDLRGLKLLNKIGAAFGSYGWSGESLNIVEDYLKTSCKIPCVVPGVKAKWQPTAEDLASCVDMGQKIGQAVKGK